MAGAVLLKVQPDIADRFAVSWNSADNYVSRIAGAMKHENPSMFSLMDLNISLEIPEGNAPRFTNLYHNGVLITYEMLRLEYLKQVKLLPRVSDQSRESFFAEYTREDSLQKRIMEYLEAENPMIPYVMPCIENAFERNVLFIGVFFAYGLLRKQAEIDTLNAQFAPGKN